MKNNNLVSVVVPTLNSESILEICLKSIKNQSYKFIELIVVDNGSKDKTIEIAKRYTNKVFTMSGKERSIQRNYGAKKSLGKYVCFIDSDMELSKNVIKDCVKKQIRSNCSGIIIPEVTIFNNFWGEVRAYERSFYIGNDFIEAGRFFLKKDFFRAGMYDKKITGQEDWSLPAKMREMKMDVNKRIKDKIYHHEENFSLLGHLKKRKYYMKTSKNYVKKHKDFSKNQFSPSYRLSVFLFNIKFYSNIKLALGVIFLKSSEYFVVLPELFRNMVN